jgi:hypothetical protein
VWVGCSHIGVLLEQCLQRVLEALFVTGQTPAPHTRRGRYTPLPPSPLACISDGKCRPWHGRQYAEPRVQHPPQLPFLTTPTRHRLAYQAPTRLFARCACSNYHQHLSSLPTHISPQRRRLVVGPRLSFPREPGLRRSEQPRRRLAYGCSVPLCSHHSFLSKKRQSLI